MNATKFYSMIEDFIKRHFGNNLEPFFFGKVVGQFYHKVKIVRTGEEDQHYEVYPVLSRLFRHGSSYGNDVLLVRVNGGKAIILGSTGFIPEFVKTHGTTQTVSVASNAWVDLPGSYYPGIDIDPVVPTKSGTVILTGRLSAWAVTNVPCYIRTRFKLTNVTDNTVEYGIPRSQSYCHVANVDIQDHMIMSYFNLEKGKGYRFSIQVSQTATVTQNVSVSEMIYECREGCY